MVWAFQIKSYEPYVEVLKKASYLTNIALDLTVSIGDVQVILVTPSGKMLLVCTLNQHTPQAQVYQMFVEGERVCFTIKGHGVVHCTGVVMSEFAEILAKTQS